VGAYENHEDGFALSTMNVGAAAPLAATRTFNATAANGTAAHTEDSAWRVGAGYELQWAGGATTPGFVFEQVKFLQGSGAAGSIAEYSRYAWSANLKHRTGAHELRARFDKANDGDCKLVGQTVAGACSTADYGSKMYSLGYAYYFAKTTQVYLQWSHILNERKAQYTFSTAGVAAVTGTTGVRGTTLPGQDPQALALGIRHAF
jgi:hypothetical protein